MQKFLGDSIQVRYKGGDNTSTSKPWAKQRPYLQDIFGRAQNLSNKPMEYFPGETVQDFSPEQTQAHQQIRDQVSGGSALNDTTNSYYNDVMSGKYLNPDTNPWLKASYDKAMEDSMPAWDTSAISAGRYGGGAWGVGKGKLQADAATGIYGGNYQQERSRMQDTASQVPAWDSNYRFGDSEKLYGVGADVQGMGQAKIDASKEKFDFGQQEEWQRLTNYSNLVSGQYGGATSTSGGK